MRTLSDKTFTTNLSIIFGLLLVTALVFWPSLNNDFVNWDDPGHLIYNPTVQALNFENIRTIFTSFINGNYQPLSIFSFALEYRLDGANPKVYHVTNLILHLLNVALVYVFINTLTGRRTTAAVTALLFGIHPLRVESVAWITERKDVLYLLFYLNALILYLYYQKNPAGRKKIYAWMFLAFILSLLAKPAAVSLPLILCLVDFYNGRGFHQRLIWEKAPFFLASFIFGLIALYGTKTPFDNTYPLVPVFHFGERLILSAHALVQYVIKLLWPVNLYAFYPYPEKINGALPASLWIAPVLIGIAVWLIARTEKHKNLFVFGTLFFILTVFFNLPLISLGHVIVADRFSYLPSIGLIYIAAELGRIYYVENMKDNKRMRFFKFAFSAFLILSCAVLTWQRCSVWKNGGTLWNDVIRKNPTIPMAFYNRADYYFANGQLEPALPDYNRAITLLPTYFAAHNNRGNTYLLLGRFEAALKDYNTAIAIKPDYVDAYLNRAAYYEYINDFEQAVVNYDKILSFSPGHPTAVQRKIKAVEKMRTSP